MLIAVVCSSNTLVFDIATYSDLQRCVEGSLSTSKQEEMELELCFTHAPSSIEFSVRCQRSFDTFISLHERGEVVAGSVPFPALHVRQVPPLRIDARAPPMASPAAPAQQNVGGADGETNTFRKARKGAAVPSASPTTGGTEPAPSAAPAVLSAAELLQSFHPEEAPMVSTVRVVMRDGCCSALVPFDPYNPPTIQSFTKSVRRSLLAAVQNLPPSTNPDTVQFRSGLMGGIDGGRLVLSFWVVGATTEVDLEDDKEVMMAARQILAAKDQQNDVQIFCEVEGSVPSCPRPDSPSSMMSPGRSPNVHKKNQKVRSHEILVDEPTDTSPLPPQEDEPQPK